MAKLESQISALHEIGADAMDNLFDIKITMPANMAEFGGDRYSTILTQDHMEKQFRLRCEGFDPPKFTQKKYEVRYKTVGMNRPAARIDGAREFSLTFRLDAYYRVYTALLGWRSILFEPSTGYASPAFTSDSPDNAENYASYFGSIEVYASILPPIRTAGGYDVPGMTHKSLYETPATTASTAGDVGDATTILRAWSFSDVWISDLTEPKFVVGGGDVQKVTATFQFGEYRAPSSPGSIQES